MVHRLLIVLALLFTVTTYFTPLVHLVPGPNNTYSPDCPEVWITGSNITGKDKNWWGIDFAEKITLFGITVIAMLQLWALSVGELPLLRKGVLLFAFAGLAVSPLWLWFYTGGVINNSDGADMQPSISYGALFVALSMLLSLLTFAMTKLQAVKQP